MMDVISLSHDNTQPPHPLTRHLYLDSQGDPSDHLTPIFPPTNFEVPDISFSNSVITNSAFNQSVLSSNQIYGRSCDLYMTPNLITPDLIGGQSHKGNSHNQSDSDSEALGHRLPVNNHPRLTDNNHPRLTDNNHPRLTDASPGSSPASSSSDDSDNHRPPQFSKRTLTPTSTHNTAVKNQPPALLSAHSTDTSSSVEVSSVPCGASKKTKSCKRRKRKDPNEPQKPVSAYALFFRDSQLAIKGHNPSASFGEISKIVASLWDQLDPEHKDLFKKRTEAAKKQYLKQLAAYRANQVSQSVSEDAKKAPSPPALGNMSIGVMPGYQTRGAGPPVESHGAVNMPGQILEQHRLHQSQSHMAHISAQFLQQHHQHQMHNQQQGRQQVSLVYVPPPSPSHQQNCPPHLELLPASNPMYASSRVDHGGQRIYQSSMVVDSAVGLLGQVTRQSMDGSYPQCVRSGCGNHLPGNHLPGNHLPGNPNRESDYCSNECIISHCRNIFTNWASSRPTSNTFPVK